MPGWPASSPWMRRQPQRGFCRASCSASAHTPAGTGGRPGTSGQVHFSLTRRRCQVRSVPGATNRYSPSCRGSNRAKATRAGAGPPGGLKAVPACGQADEVSKPFLPWATR